MSIFLCSLPPHLPTTHTPVLHRENSQTTMDLLTSQALSLGPAWIPVYLMPVDFSHQHFETAMAHLIREPNINSTVILRADVLEETIYNSDGNVESTASFSPDLPERESADSENSQLSLLHRDLSDITLRKVDLVDSINLQPDKSVIRRIIPRNPYKDHIINQTCLIHKGPESVLVVYVPHIEKLDETPFYLPPVYAVGILYHQNTLSIHYVPFSEDKNLRKMDSSERPIRIALRLLQTSAKHSLGVKAGYEKRVNHDLVVPRVAFQNRYIALKKKYSGPLVANWVESTDPKKHVFEDLAVAAFLIELWHLRYKDDKNFEFRDLGCGNGLLVHILILEGFKGKGIDARARKSWKTYPTEVQDNLLEQIIIPSVLLKPHPAVTRMAPYIRDNGRLFQVAEFESRTPSSVPLMKYYSSANLLELSKVCTTEDFPPNTFLIGNHLDELTCWLPLLDFPFMVIPCCSHALNGAKIRYNPRKVVNSQTNTKQAANVSTYGALVDHVEELSEKMGWVVEKEILRIPSTRNAAVIGMKKKEEFANEPEEMTELRVFDILAMEGGAEGWVENLMLLMKKSPKNH